VVQHQVGAGLRRQAAAVAGEHAAEPVVPCTQAAGPVVPDRPVERVVDNVVVVLNKQAVQEQEVVAAPVAVELPVVPVASELKLLEQVPVVEPIVEPIDELIAELIAADVVAVADVVVVAAVATAIAAGFAVAAVDDTGAALPVTARTERPEFVEIEFAG
jgi:hypothetical protein